jgi:hypothetical protein
MEAYAGRDRAGLAERPLSGRPAGNALAEARPEPPRSDMVGRELLEADARGLAARGGLCGGATLEAPRPKRRPTR